MEYQEAVDLILQFTGETPVNSPNEHPLQGVIERFINSSSSREQLLGWWFNEDENVTLQVREDGKVEISSQIKQIVFESRDYVDRGGFVYDKANQTYFIKEDVTALRTFRVLEWNELPELMQQWIMFQAAKYYVVSTIGDSGVTAEMKEESNRTLYLLKSQDLKAKNINVFRTPQIALARSGRRPYIRR